MDLEFIYENVDNEDIQNTTGLRTHIHSQDKRKHLKHRGSRCLVLITVSLGIICVLLLIFIILLNITITAERDMIKNYKNTVEELNRTINRLNSGWFFMSNEEKSWSESRQYCRDHGADLVIINTEEKQRLISSLTVERVWIGLSDTEQEGSMKWVDNLPLIRGFWLQGEPNNYGGNEDCIELNHAREEAGWSPLKSWNDHSCSDGRKAICEK